MTPLTLSDDKLDALQELVNIGMGAAGAALAKALGAFVELTVPGIDFTDRRSVPRLLDGGLWAKHEVEAVRQPFFGAFTGESLMVFDERVHAQLADLPGYAVASSGKPSTAEQQETLLDLANVVIGACVTGIADPLHEKVSFGAPTQLGSRADVRAYLSQEPVAWHQGLIVNLDFKLEARSFLSRVLVFLPEHSLQRIDQALTQLLDGLAAS
jgi:chemotaxis protein CheC